MEGTMAASGRPRPPCFALSSPAPAVRGGGSPIAFVSSGRDDMEARRRRHSSTCLLGGTAAVASIWHAIMPSSSSSSSSCAAQLARRRRTWWHGPGEVEEGSWSAGWDARPARWLHGPDSAWLLFGVCSCFNPPVPDLCATAEAAEVSGDGDAADSAKPNYSVTGMLADGRCLFRAVTYGACLSKGQETPAASKQTELADDLRARVAEELLKRRDEVERFVEGDFNEYVERIQKPFVWGGEPELLMASHVLRSPLSVYMLDRSADSLVNIANYGAEYAREESGAIKVLFHGYGHYDALEVY